MLEKKHLKRDSLLTAFGRSFCFITIYLEVATMSNKEIVIDLTEVKKKFNSTINEALSDAMSWWTSTLLQATYGSQGIQIPFRLVGSRDELRSLISTMGLERRYLADAARYGLDNPVTYKTKNVLRAAINNFETKTGIPWPFKD